MKTKITKIEPINIKKFGENAYFVYFTWYNREEKTIVTQKVQNYLKFNILKVGDFIDIQKGFYKENVKYMITKVLNENE